MVIMEKGHFGQYTGNARHSRTPVTKKNYRASVADDAAHIHYLKEDINYDAKHGHSDENMTADEKHISKLAGDMKYDKKHHSPLNTNHPFEPKTGESIYDEDGFLKEEYSSPGVVASILTSDINRADDTTFSIGDELSDFRPVPYSAGGGTAFALPVNVAYDRNQRGLPPSARNMQTRVTGGGQNIYSQEDMQNVIDAVQAQNAPVNRARRNLNAANYSQEMIDQYNEQERATGGNRIYRQKSGQRTRNPRSIRTKG